MANKYPEEIYEFVKANVEGRTNKELAEMVNVKFDMQFTEGSMKSYVGNHKLYRKKRGGYRKVFSKTFPEEIVEYIKVNYKGIGPKEMAAVLNAKFGSSYTKEQLTAYYKNHKLNSGLDGRFQKGHQNPHKGDKNYRIPNSEATRFKPGNKPHNTVPVGTEIVDTDGYHKVKVAEPNKWEFVHKRVWKQHFGKIPKGMMVSFKDRNKDNLSPDNLMLISNEENLELIRSHLRFDNQEATTVGLTVAKVKIAARNRKKMHMAADDKEHA